MLASLRATVPEIFNLRPSFPLPVEADLFFRESLKFPNAEFREQIGVWLIKEFGLPDEESEPLIEEYLVLYSQNFLEAMGAIPQLGYIEMVPNSFMLDELLTITGRIENMLPLPRSGPDKRYWPMREFLKMVAQNWDDWFSSAGRPEAKGGAPSIKPLHRHDFPSRS